MSAPTATSQGSGFTRFLTSWQLLFAVALAVRLAYVATLDSTGLTWDDERDHDTIAWNLAQTGQFESSPYRAAPLFPAFLAVVYKVFGHSFTAARAAQALLGAVLAVMVFAASRILFCRRSALLAGWGTAFYPQLIYLTGVFYAEHMYAVLLAGAVLSLIRCRENPTALRAAVAGLLVALSALCRPVGLAFIPVAAAYVWWSAPPRSGIRLPALFLAAALLAISPWTARNALAFGRFVPVAAGQGLHMWIGNNALSRGDADDRHLRPGGAFLIDRVSRLDPEQRAFVESGLAALRNDLARLDGVAQDRRMMSEAVGWIRAHPLAFVRKSLRRAVTLHEAFSRTLSANETTSARNRFIASVTFYPVLALGFVGAVLAWRGNRASWVLHAVVLTMTAVYVPMNACTRFRLPVDPYWIIFASVAAAFALARMSERLACKAKP